jgi:hypothetical protein
LSSSEEEEIGIGTKEGKKFEYGSHVEEGTNIKLGLWDKRFSSILTSLLIIISLQCG